MNPTHTEAVEAFRKAQDELLATSLTDAQAEALIALMNAAQALNTLYWEQMESNAGGVA